MVRYQLQEDVNQRVTDKHVVEISQHFCEKWERLPPHLEMRKIAASDIKGSEKSGEEKRREFFYKWIDEKGSGATYKKLIHSLLKANCIDDAEEICKLIQPQPPPTPPGPVSDPAMSRGNMGYLCIVTHVSAYVAIGISAAWLCCWTSTKYPNQGLMGIQATWYQ